LRYPDPAPTQSPLRGKNLHDFSTAVLVAKQEGFWLHHKFLLFIGLKEGCMAFSLQAGPARNVGQ
jgi:hypothetical protein